MSNDFPIFIPKRRKPIAGSRRMPDERSAEKEHDTMNPELRAKLDALRPPWAKPLPEQVQEKQKKIRSDFSKLKAARKKAEELGEVVRDNAFDDWVEHYLDKVQKPSEWTQARELYENYLKRAKQFGHNRGDKRLSTQELATETQWGKMMGWLYPNKKRRTKGWYYPVRLKQGA